MTFIKETTHYQKTGLSDLQGAWINLRSAVVDHFGFPDSDRLLFHIDEAMSWECVRNLPLMKERFIVVQNIALQGSAPEEVLDWISVVREDMEDVFDEENR